MKLPGRIHLLLIMIILLGVFVRFNQLDAHSLNGDEEFYIIAAQKFHAGSDYDVRIWNYHAPPVAKYLMSLSLAGTDSYVDYTIPHALPANLWVWNYLAYESVAQVYPLVRSVSAIFGVLFILFIFLTAREIFGPEAGLWAAASAAVAVDLIMLSRVAMVDIFLYAFIASTMFFYVKYRKSGKQVPWLVALLASLVLMFGSKNAQWLVIIPPMLYVEIMGNRKNILRTANLLIVLGVAWFIHSSFIYPPEISGLADEFFTSGAHSSLIEPHPANFFATLFTTNSCFFLLTFLLTAAFYLAALGRDSGISRLKSHLLNPTPHTFLILLAMVSLLTFSLTSLSLSSKYISQLSIPFLVLGGFVVTRLWKIRPLKAVFLLLILAGAFSALWYAPSYESYPGQQVIRFSSPETQEAPYFETLENAGNPPAITNLMNLLIFYDGTAVPIPVKDSPACIQELPDALEAGGYYGAFRNIGEDEKMFLCSLVFEYSREVVSIDEKSSVVLY